MDHGTHFFFLLYELCLTVLSKKKKKKTMPIKFKPFSRLGPLGKYCKNFLFVWMTVR